VNMPAATNGRRHRAPPRPAAPWPHTQLPAPAESTVAAVPAYEAEPEPADATGVFWLELPPHLAPYVRLGMRFFDGERQLVLRIVRELGEPEGYSEIQARATEMQELAVTILDVCGFVNSYGYGVSP
jgi:hypothetical protein